MKRVKIVKIEERPDAKHPNNILVGFEKIGIPENFPEIGECFRLNTGWHTSVVEEIIAYDIFKTNNSIYQIVPLTETEDFESMTGDPVPLADGVYDALWSAYNLEIKYIDSINVKTVQGIRGVNCHVKVEVIGGRVKELSKDDYK